jgi:phosphoribosylformylglycinamidine synthase
MRFAVVSFPGSNCDDDCLRVAAEVLGETAYKVRHDERDLQRPDVVLLPGGFSYGDYLRCGAIASLSPVMEAVGAFARGGGPVLGICNGFQILTESHLLPGALLRNAGLQFICEDAHVRVEGRPTPFTAGVQGVLRLPIAHHDGRYHADADTLARLEGEGRVVFRYCGPDGTVGDAFNPNGAAANIAGICNEGGNVVGMMPHPERNAEPLLGDATGRALFDAALRIVGGAR